MWELRNQGGSAFPAFDYTTIFLFWKWAQLVSKGWAMSIVLCIVCAKIWIVSNIDSKMASLRIGWKSIKHRIVRNNEHWGLRSRSWCGLRNGGFDCCGCCMGGWYGEGQRGVQCSVFSSCRPICLCWPFTVICSPTTSAHTSHCLHYISSPSDTIWGTGLFFAFEGPRVLRFEVCRFVCSIKEHAVPADGNWWELYHPTHGSEYLFVKPIFEDSHNVHTKPNENIYLKIKKCTFLKNP